MRRTLGEALRTLRRRARLSQGGLAEASGVSRATISLIERGGTRPTPLTLEQLARGLATDADGEIDQQARAQAFAALLVDAGYPLAGAAPGNLPTRPNAEDRVAEVLARHPNIKVAFAQVDELDEDDAEMIVQVVEYVARRGAEKRRRAGREPGNAND
jgi:transcriptional regulator with XRE-family HTH domain